LQGLLQLHEDLSRLSAWCHDALLHLRGFRRDVHAGRDRPRPESQRHDLLEDDSFGARANELIACAGPFPSAAPTPPSPPASQRSRPQNSRFALPSSPCSPSARGTVAPLVRSRTQQPKATQCPTSPRVEPTP